MEERHLSDRQALEQQHQADIEHLHAIITACQRKGVQIQQKRNKTEV